MEQWGYMPWYGMIFGPIIMIGVLFIVVRLMGGMGCMQGHYRDVGSKAKSALDILEERFARGDIEKNEFEEKKRTLLDG